MKSIDKFKVKKFLSINSEVLFRPTSFFSRRNKNAITIHLKNLKTGSQYEFKGLEAFLWLLLDGSRTEEQALIKCKHDLQIKDPMYEKKACKFLNALLREGLISQVQNRAKKDARSVNMAEFTVSKMKANGLLSCCRCISSTSNYCDFL